MSVNEGQKNLLMSGICAKFAESIGEIGLD